jgi:ribonuclease P protein component
MLHKTERMNRTQFSAFFASGRRVHGSYTTLLISSSDRFSCSVVVSKKVAKKAHDRNRIKRRLYAIIKTLETERQLIGGFIILAKPAIARLTKREFGEFLMAEIGRGVTK